MSFISKVRNEYISFWKHLTLTLLCKMKLYEIGDKWFHLILICYVSADTPILTVSSNFNNFLMSRQFAFFYINNPDYSILIYLP